MEPDDIFMKREDLMRHLEEESKVFDNLEVKAAFKAIDRKDFLHDDYKVEAYEDYPLPTLEGQTISQPTTVAFMLELLDPQEGDIVLDIGSGSGWVTALLGHMVGPEGRVIGLEIKPELVKQSKINLKKYSKLNLPVEIRQADKETGLYKEGPYNRIISGASFPTKEDAPVELLLQLAQGGVMVVPVGDSLFKFEKVSDEEVVETEFEGFTFVPYIS